MFTCCVKAVLYLCRIVHLQQVVAAEFDVRHRDAMLEEIDRELRSTVCVRFCGSLIEKEMKFIRANCNNLSSLKTWLVYVDFKISKLCQDRKLYNKDIPYSCLLLVKYQI